MNGVCRAVQSGRITDFDTIEGDRIQTHITPGWFYGDFQLAWRGAADPGFTAMEGQSLALAGADAANPRYLEFWTTYDAVTDETALYMDLDRDFIVDANDLKIVFDGLVALTRDSISAATLLALRGTDAADGTDTLAPTDLEDMLLGVGGADTLRGGAGNDTLAGDDGSDVLAGDAGDDWLLGGAQDDDLHGGQGEDTVAGGTGSDTVRGVPAMTVCTLHTCKTKGGAAPPMRQERATSSGAAPGMTISMATPAGTICTAAITMTS